MHPPKIELFDVSGMTNTDPKGFVRAVDDYRVTDFGLYMARPLQDHPDIAYFRSWLLPAHGLRLGRWTPHEGRELDYDVYIDVVDIDTGDIDTVDIHTGDLHTGDVWRTVDLYLDLLVRDGRDVRVLDVDEVLAAHVAGLVDEPTARRAFDRAFAAVEGIAAAGYQVERWLDLPLTWPRP